MKSVTHPDTAIDLAPAEWIWFPSKRTLPNTFVLFRREFDLSEAPIRADGWISADSRYRLTVNGARVQWGPAPCDPRWLEADGIDLTPYLRPGKNIIGAEVLYFGHGDGTWAMGKPGFIFKLELKLPASRTETIVSNASWQCRIDRAHRPGQHKRWYLRALQEEFDARLHPRGWDSVGYMPDSEWLNAMRLDCSPGKPPLCSAYSDYLYDSSVVDPAECHLRKRTLPPLTNIDVRAQRLTDSRRVDWLLDPRDWFDFRTPDSFRIQDANIAEELADGSYQLPAATGNSAVLATFEFSEQIVGWPYFTIDAAEGTIVELITQESHDPSHTPWLDNHFYAWSRFICREGANHFEAFDYESLRWLQLHIRNSARPVTIRRAGVRRRLFPWPKEPRVRCAEPELQRLFEASLNTICNSVMETIVDGAGRERQQYGGDVAHQLHAVRLAYGETAVARRYLLTLTDGQTPEGYFMDCWPGFDRLCRIAQRLLGFTVWGPLLDHNASLGFECFNHYMATGELEPLRTPYTRILRLAHYLESIRRANGLLPVENIGVPNVFMDHDAYRQTRHKQCAFNLYVSAMLLHALAPLAEAFGDTAKTLSLKNFGASLLAAVVREFWCSKREVFVNNLPWQSEEETPRYCEMSLSTAILFNQCPEQKNQSALNLLIERPPEFGRNFPANAGWRYWALSRMGRADVALREFREQWAQLPSVLQNGTIQETWTVRPDSTDQWSHSSVAPLYILFSDIAGIRALAPGYLRYQVRPQLGDLRGIDLTAHLPQGSLHFKAEWLGDSHRITIIPPETGEGELVLPPGTDTDLHPLGLHRFRLVGGKPSVVIIAASGLH
jgi:alpha-L-rhamnosidase